MSYCWVIATGIKIFFFSMKKILSAVAVTPLQDMSAKTKKQTLEADLSLKLHPSCHFVAAWGECTSSTRRSVCAPCVRTRSCWEVKPKHTWHDSTDWREEEGRWRACPCVFLADLCRDQFSRCGVMALSGQCASLAGSCGKSCGGCWWWSGTPLARILPPPPPLLLLPPASSLCFSCTIH